jgi:DNA-binding beta-propeller fold protein YncE
MLNRRHRVAINAVATALLVVGACVAAAPASAASAAWNPKQVATIGGSASGHAQLYGWGAATMKDGSVIIGDYWNHRVVQYKSDGTFVGVLFNLAPVPTVYSAPYGLAVDTSGGTYDGDIYVGFECCAVERWFLSGAGHYVRSAPRLTGPGMKYPSRVAVGNTGTVYVSDMIADKIFVYDTAAVASGRPSAQWGAPGSGPQQFSQPRGIALDSSTPQRLYVADTNNRRVAVVDTSTGLFVNTFNIGIGLDVRGLAIDRTAGIVYLVDDSSGTVHRYDLNGNPMSDLGGPWVNDGRNCCAPPGLFANGGREATVDGLGNLWVGDMPDFRVQVWSRAGAFVGAFPNPAPANCDQSNATSACPLNGGFNGPHGVAVEPTGSVVVTDTYNFRLETFNSAGTWQSSQGMRGSSRYGLDYPMGIVVNPSDGSVVVADAYNNAVKKYDAAGSWVWTYVGVGSKGLKRPEGVALGPNGTIYVADLLHKQIAILHDGGTSASWNSAISCACLTHPSGVAVDAVTGHAFAADNTTVIEFDQTGAFVRTIGGAGSGSPLQSPFDVVLDGTNLYVTDAKANAVKIYREADGVFQTSFGSKGAGAGQLNMPLGLVLNSAGHLFVADSANDRITEWCVQGC